MEPPYTRSHHGTVPLQQKDRTVVDARRSSSSGSLRSSSTIATYQRAAQPHHPLHALLAVGAWCEVHDAARLHDLPIPSKAAPHQVGTQLLGPSRTSRRRRRPYHWMVPGRPQDHLQAIHLHQDHPAADQVQQWKRWAPPSGRVVAYWGGLSLTSPPRHQQSGRTQPDSGQQEAAPRM